MRKNQITFLSIVVATVILMGCGEDIDRHEKNKSAMPSVTDRYKPEKTQIQLRPSPYIVSVPFNHLYAIHSNRVGLGNPESNPYVGKMWDRVEVWMLLPKFDARSPQNEAAFNADKGNNVLSITLMMRMGLDGDVRKAWQNTLHLNTYWKQPPLSPTHHQDLGLNEYFVDVDHDVRYFTSDQALFRCWYAPFSHIHHVCESSYSLTSNITVTYAFPFKHLARWKEIDSFVRQTVDSYKLTKADR